MTYGDYRFHIKRPEGWNSVEWAAHHARVRAMANWITEQKWDHWGHHTEDGREEFWFNVEEEYIWFVLRWSS